MPINSIYIEINNSCNNRCIYCYNRDRSNKYMKIKEFETIISKASEAGIENVILSGGEPTIHPDFLELIKVLHKYSMNFGLSTNGVNINEEIIKSLQENENTFIQVSLDTVNPNIYKKIRGVDSLKQVIKNIKKLLDNNFDLVIGIVLSKLTIESLDNTVNYLCDLGITTIHVDEVTNVGFASDVYDELYIDDYYYVLNNLYNLQKQLYPKISIDLIEDILIRSITLHDKQFSYCNTLQGNMLQIDCTGNVFRCKNIGDEMKIGNIYDKNYENIIIKTSKENFCLTADDIECKTCAVKKICRGSCRAKAFSATNNINSKSYRCKELFNFCSNVLKDKEKGLIDDLLFEIELSYELNKMNGFTKWV